MKWIITRLAIALLSLPCSTAFAQQPKTSSGTYAMYVGEQQIGTETYTISVNADGSTRSEADVAFAGTKFRAITLLTGNRPNSYTMEMAGAVSLKEDFNSDGVRVTVPGQPDRQVKSQPNALFENGLAHQFIFLLAQYERTRGGLQSFNAFVPSQATPFTVNLQRVDTPEFKVGNQQIVTEHFRAGTDLGLAFEIWANNENVPLVIKIAAQRVKIVRGGFEALAELIVPAAAKPAASASDPFSSEEVSFQNGAQKLAGTLTVPKTGAVPFPAVIIISGSGGQDRDGSNVANFYRLIAERLSANGVAVLRVDDRGIGNSVPLITRTTSYRDLINDSLAAFEFLSTRKEIDHKRIALAGHSEGAQTALTIATEDARVAAIILLAGASRTLDRIVTEQALYGIALAAPVNPSDRTRFAAISIKLEQWFRDAKEKKPASTANDELTYFREHLASDPLTLARKVRVPVLLLNGERDGNVMVYHALELAQALADSGNKQVLVRIFPNLTHLFTPSQLDKAVTDTQAGIVSSEVLETLQKWATNVLVNGKDGGSLP